MNISDLKQNQTNNPSNLEKSSNSSVTESVEPLTVSNPSELTTDTTSLAEATIQKEPEKDIMKHLKQSNGNLSYFSTEAKERSSQIKEHIQKSLSWEKAEIGVL